MILKDSYGALTVVYSIWVPDINPIPDYHSKGKKHYAGIRAWNGEYHITHPIEGEEEIIDDDMSYFVDMTNKISGERWIDKDMIDIASDLQDNSRRAIQKFLRIHARRERREKVVLTCGQLDASPSAMQEFLSLHSKKHLRDQSDVEEDLLFLAEQLENEIQYDEIVRTFVKTVKVHDFVGALDTLVDRLVENDIVVSAVIRQTLKQELDCFKAPTVVWELLNSK